MKKITLIVYMLIMISFMGISCKKNVNYDVRYFGFSNDNAFEHLNEKYDNIHEYYRSYCYIGNTTTLKIKCENYYSPTFDETSSKYNSEVNILLRSYTDEFFETKTLLICFGTSKKEVPQENVKAVKFKDNIITITCKKNTNNQDVKKEMTPWILILELEKKDIDLSDEKQLRVKYKFI